MADTRSRLTDVEVLEVVRLFNRRESITTIARKSGRSQATIRRIVTGKAHRKLTCPDHVPDPSCSCLSCTYERCRDDNLAIAERQQCQVKCQYCLGFFWKRVVDVVRRHGYVFCESCNGRGK